LIPLVGLTGGIGAGKSEARRCFARLGIPTLDLDAVGHRLLAEDASVQREVVRAFPDAVCNGVIDRKKLGAIVFSDRKRLARLEAILHPRIWQQVAHWQAELPAAPYALIEASAIIESGATNRVDALVVVLASLEVRKARIAARGHPSLERFEAIVALQCSDEERKRHADFCIVNEGSLAELEEQVRAIDARLRMRFCTNST